jgi:hypothetical protein
MITFLKKRYVLSGRTVTLMACFLSLFYSQAKGQTNGAGGQIKTPETVTTFIDRRVRESELRRIAMADVSKADTRVDRAMYEKMNEDFKQIQLIRLRMVENIADGKPFEYKTLSADASEIKRRAVRLRSSLVLLTDKEKKKLTIREMGFDGNTIQDAASDLCLEISRFTTNPMFQPGATYTLRYATEADQSLDKIISLSSGVKDSANKLRH